MEGHLMTSRRLPFKLLPLACLLLAASSLRLALAAPSPEPPPMNAPPSRAVVAEWKKQGAMYGRLLGRSSAGQLEGRDELAFISDSSTPGGKGLPAFLLARFSEDALKKLPAPDVPFALCLQGEPVTDGAWKVLA